MNEFEYIQKINDIELEELKTLLEKYKSQEQENTKTKRDNKTLKKVYSIENSINI